VAAKPDVYKLNFKNLNLPEAELANFKSKVLDDLRRSAIDKRLKLESDAGFDLEFDLSFDLGVDV